MARGRRATLPRLSPLLVVLFLASACGGAAIRDRYRRSHGRCTADVSIRERSHQPGVFDASGCGDDVIYRACVTRVSAGSWAAPSSSPTAGGGGAGGNSCMFNLRSEAIQRFHHANGCAQSMVTTLELGPGQLGVMGCGRRGVFVSTVSGWMQSSDSTDLSPPAR